jgi:hypothetical protein
MSIEIETVEMEDVNGTAGASGNRRVDRRYLRSWMRPAKADRV